MALSAIGTGAVDRVLPLERIPAELVKLVTRPFARAATIG